MTERPVFSECVIGYRSWKLDDWVLSPVSFGSPWRPGVNHATCQKQDMFGVWTYSMSLTSGGMSFSSEPAVQKPKHAAPQQNCTCGLHAYHELPEQAAGIVVGAVAAWGDLQVHSNGFRAEHAQIVALVTADGLDDVAALYGVPLVPRDMLAAEAQQHGSPLPESMRPEPPKPVEVDFDSYTAGGMVFTSNTFRSALSSYMWGTPSYTPRAPRIHSPAWYTQPTSVDIPALTSELWTPAEDEDKSAEDKLAKYTKPPANRQGPAKPKRAPKNLGGGR